MSTKPTAKPEVETKSPTAPTIADLAVTHNFTVEDNTDASGEPEELPVEETERTLTSGLTVVDYV